MNETALQLAGVIIKGIQEKKGHDLVCLNLSKINSSVCDFFIICHGDSHVHVEAISDSVREQVYKAFKEKPWHSEGGRNSEWILIDFVNVVAHIFLKEKRDFYNLEGLWADGEFIKVGDNGSVEMLGVKKRKIKKTKSAKPVAKKSSPK